MRISDWSSDVCSSDLQSSRNARNLTVEGIDGQFNYRADIGELGSFVIGTGFTYFTKFRQNFGGGTDFSILNTSGYNTTFPSVRFKNRAQLGWAKDGLSADSPRSEEHTSELQSLMRISYAVFCLKKKNKPTQENNDTSHDVTL